MPLPLVIINPESASGSTRKAWPQLASDLRSHFGSFSTRFTSAPREAASLASEAARKGVNFIIACGGDGTISEVANGILESGKDVELGILPSGTGGDFRRSLEIPPQSRNAARILSAGRTRRIDVGRVTYLNKDGTVAERFFLGVASCGMSTRVIERVKAGGPDWLPSNTPKWLSGRISFGASMLQTAAKTNATRIVVQLDDAHERHLAVVSFCVANARFFGGGMKIAPDARLTDGKFDVVSVGDLSALKIMTSAPRVYAGSHLSMPEVSHTLARKIQLRAAETSEEINLEIDGELPGRLPATFQMIPAALRVRCGA
ncbi:MAG TPA: diacylglycerol kinase family protein [Pyrinomonadaceae bacterium]|nr:diacylglycerol kinase family protein [Pyrinomonadaceae bacterium]